MVVLEVSEGTLEFKKEVVVGVIDSSAAGARLLLPLLSSPNAKRAAITVKKTNKWEPSPAFDLKGLSLGVVESFSLEETSFLIVNTTVPEEEESTFAFELTQFILNHSQENTSISFLFAMDFGALIKSPSSPQTFTHTNKKSLSLPSSSPLPPNTPIKNGFVASLVHLFSTIEVFSQFCLFVSHGKVVRSPSSPERDGTLEVMERLGGMFCGVFPCFSSVFSSFDASLLVPVSFSPSSSESLMYL